MQAANLPALYALNACSRYTIQLDGKTTDWMEKVSDEQYQAGLRAE